MTTVSDENEKLIINFAWPKVMNVTTEGNEYHYRCL